MHKINTLIIAVFLIVACGEQKVSSKEYFDKGMKFVQGGNSNGAIIALKKALENDQNFFEARYQLAQAYLMQDKYKSAETELIKVLRLNPSFDEARLSLAKAYLNTERIDEALDELNLYMKSNDKNSEAYELSASAYAAKKDYKKAEELLKSSLEISPQSISSQMLLASVYMADGKVDKAETYVNEVLDADEKNKRALYMLTSIKAIQGKDEEVISTYEKILEVDPQDVTAKFRIGLNHLNRREFDKARQIAADITKWQKKRYEGPYLTGLINYHEKRIDEAIVSFQETLKKAALPGAYYYLGLCHLYKGDLEQATSELQRAVDAAPKMIQARLLLATTHLKGGRIKAAEKETKKVLELDNKHAFAHNLMGSVYLAMNKGEEAMDEFDRAIELDPKLIDAHIKKGMINLFSGDQKNAENEFIDAVEVAPELLNNRVILVKYYIKIKEFDKALEILREGLQERPDDATFYNLMGLTYIGMKDSDKAVESFEKAKLSNGDFFPPYYNLAAIYLSKGETERASSEYINVLEKASGNVNALLMMAKLMEFNKKQQDALSYYIRAKEQKQPIAYYSLAQYHIRQKENKKAIDVLDELLTTNPKDINAMDMKGQIYRADKNYKAALSVFKQLTTFSRDLGVTRVISIYDEMKDYDSAIKELTELLRKHSDNAKLIEAMMRIYLKQKKFAEAEKSAKDIIALYPEKEYGYELLASVYISSAVFNRAIDALKQADYNKAIDALKKAEKISPDKITTQLALGKTYMSINLPHEAMKYYEKAQKINPEYAPVYFHQAGVYEQLGNKKNALEKYKKTIELNPDYVPALNNLAYLYAEGHGSLDKAVDMAEKARSLAPKAGSVTDTLGWVHYKKGDYDEALKYFIEASHQLPGNPSIRYHIGMAYLKKGMNDEAEEQLKNAMRLGRQTTFAEVEETKKLLEDIAKK